MLRVCRTTGPTAYLKMLHQELSEKFIEREKKIMTVPGTCSHPVYTQTLIEVYQAFSYLINLSMLKTMDSSNCPFVNIFLAIQYYLETNNYYTRARVFPIL